ncbi:DNA gyrase subunit A, partial [Candidatus Sumerlaeota bacterium]|nr:DNA gyrase subunit A [Candidatus Sumerlaeota bacterium]
GIIMLALVDGRPRYLSIKKILSLYLEHRREIVVRRTRFDLDKARKRHHIVLGLRVAVDNIDEVIKIIRGSDSTDDARAKLIKRFDLSEEQATAILDMPLRRLTGLERENLEKEEKELVALIEDLAAILADPKKVTKIIGKELDEVKTKHADKRMTEITDSGEELTIEDMIAEERMVITVTHDGYIKRTPTSVYRNQRRGGKGVTGMDPKENDWVEHLFIGTTHNYILFLTDKGKAYWLKVYELPQAGRASRGRPIVNLIELEKGENIKALLPVEKFSEDRYLIMATKQGQVVRNALSLYSNPRKGGIKAINVADGDELIDAKISNGNQEIFLGTRGGMAVRFKETQIRPMGRFVGGVRGIRLRKNDEVIGLGILQANSSILTVCANGYGKRTDAEEYRLTNRGGIGVINIKTTQRNGEVIAILEVVDEDELIMISVKGITIRSAVKELRKISRATQGVRLINLGEGDKLSSVARTEEDREPEGNASESPGNADAPDSAPDGAEQKE